MLSNLGGTNDKHLLINLLTVNRIKINANLTCIINILTIVI